MKRKIIRITESDLFNVVRNSVNRLLKETSNVITEAFKDKQKIIRHLYKIIAPFTHSKYHDSDWSGVRSLINAIEDAGYDVSVSVKDGGYRNSAGGNTLYPHEQSVSYWKEYLLTINVDGNEIHGHINACFCGTMEDPYASYDLTCNFY